MKLKSVWIFLKVALIMGVFVGCSRTTPANEAITEKKTESTEQKTESTEEKMKSTEQKTESTEEKAESMKQETDSTEKKLESTEQGIDSTEQESENEEAHNAVWSYAGQTGPAYWGKLDPAFEIADSGEHQSPINIEIDEAIIEKEEVPITYNYQPVLFEAENNGHSIEVIPHSKDNSITIDGEVYTLNQYHMHTSSEHQINGKYYDMEIHFVHTNEAGQIAVIGVMATEGAENNALSELFSLMPEELQEEGSACEVKESIDLSALIPTDSNVFRYEGSLTTPPTVENVLWHIYETPIELSREQLETFKALYPNNKRPTQPLNGREIIEYK
jgi:carbonic anhydrase